MIRTSTRLTRGEVWLVELGPTRGREQTGTRPCVVVSNDDFNQSGYELVLVVPTTRTRRASPLHVAIDPPEGGLRFASFVMCEQTRSVSTDRLLERWGAVTPATLRQIDLRVRRIFEP